MRLLHTADWHIGRRLHGFDLEAEQRNAFAQIEQIARDEKVDGIIIAGDLYDRSLPSEQSVQLLNQMLKKLNLTDQFPIYAISGNHDSATRLSTGSEWFRDTNLYINTKVAQAFSPIEFSDVQLFLLPFFEPFEVRQYFNDDSIQHIDQAFAAIIDEMKKSFAPNKKHVLVSHFFAAGSATTDSETRLTVGGLAAVPTAMLTDFDYVALGHLHGKDAIHEARIQYSGSPVKFSLSEANQQKGIFIVDTNDVTNRQFFPISPLHDVKQLTESFETLMDPNYYQDINRDDYIGISITNQNQIANMMAQLRKIYPKIIELKRQNGYEMAFKYSGESAKQIRSADPLELMKRFYRKIAKQELTEDQLKWAQAALKDVQNGGKDK